MTNGLPDTVELAVGMKVMVTENIKSDLDVKNGARVEIVDIILHPDEPPLSSELIITLKHLSSGQNAENLCYAIGWTW